ncbi:MAG: hypothetical protein GXP39_07920 [Chloroflexi bacterium]|nr:hypothetical protein [Chloroflexota bacterium]
MSFGHGSQAKVYANGYDLSSYLSQFSASGSADTAEVTTFGKSAKVYIAGLKDATFSGEGFYDGATDAVDAVLSAALGVDDVVWVWLPQGDGFGNDGYGFECIETSYEVSSPVDGATTVSVEGQSSSGMERLDTLHALGAEAAAGSGSALDNGASTSNGGSAYLIVTAVPGTPATVTVEHSPDNVTWSTLATFSAVSGRSGQRVEISGTIDRYVRVSWDQPCTFWAGIHRD